MQLVTLLFLLMFSAGCSGITHYQFHDDSAKGRQWRVAEVHNTNWWQPSWSYTILELCDYTADSDKVECQFIAQNPHVSAGIATAILPAMLQGGGSVGGGALIGAGLRKSGSSTNISQTNSQSSSLTGGNATANANATATTSGGGGSQCVGNCK